MTRYRPHVNGQPVGPAFRFRFFAHLWTLLVPHRADPREYTVRREEPPCA